MKNCWRRKKKQRRTNRRKRKRKLSRNQAITKAWTTREVSWATTTRWWTTMILNFIDYFDSYGQLGWVFWIKKPGFRWNLSEYYLKGLKKGQNFIWTGYISNLRFNFQWSTMLQDTFLGQLRRTRKPSLTFARDKAALHSQSMIGHVLSADVWYLLFPHSFRLFQDVPV